MTDNRRHLDDFKGPKTLEQWIDVYERRAGDDVHFQLEDGEHLYYNPERGFFTWRICENHPGWISIPKMCGDGKFMREVICEFLDELSKYGIRAALCCSRRKPEVWEKVHGGVLEHVDHTVNLNTGRLEPLYFYIIDPKEYRRRTDHEVHQSPVLQGRK